MTMKFQHNCVEYLELEPCSGEDPERISLLAIPSGGGREKTGPRCSLGWIPEGAGPLLGLSGGSRVVRLGKPC